MAILGQRLRRVLCTVSRTMRCSLALALASSLSLAPGIALAAGSRSHAHRPGAAPLPASSFVATGATHTSKKHKGGGRTNTGARPAETSHPAHSGKGAKASRRRSRQPEPVEDLVPMYRAGRNAARHGQELARRDKHGRLIGKTDRDERVASSQHLAERRPAKASNWRRNRREDVDERPETATTAKRWSRTVPKVLAASAEAPRQQAHASGSENGVAAAGMTAKPTPYAEGVSHPDDDERLPAKPSVVVTADPDRPRVPAARPEVVEGFGGEVAISGADTSSRPGGTRRRNHPVTASALPDLTMPSTLEDRQAITEAAVSPAVLPEIYDRAGHLVVPAPLKGSREVLVHQNTMAASDGLGRIRDDGELDRLRSQHLLVSFPVNASLHLNEELPYNRRYARPWTVQFAADIAREFYNRFHEPLQVNSAVRTVTFQARLQRVNGNAAAIDGDTASPHLTGQAIDLGKRGMSSAELAWMRAYLLPLMEAGKIDVEEEFQQACFHISVYRRYAAGRPVHEVAQLRPSSPTSPAPTTGTEEPEDTP